MANEENLIPLTERRKEDARRIRQKGAHAANKKRRKKANLKRSMETLLKLDIPDPNYQNTLKKMGLEPTVEQALVFSLTINGIKKGDPRAFTAIQQVIGQDKTLSDRAEQKARTEKLRAETKKLKTDGAIADVPDDGFLDALNGKAGEIWNE